MHCIVLHYVIIEINATNCSKSFFYYIISEIICVLLFLLYHS
jgi:hypothetical protein